MLLAQDIKDEHAKSDPAKVRDRHHDQKPAEHLRAPYEREAVADLVDDVAYRERSELRGRDLEDRRHPVEHDKGRQESERGGPHGTDATDGRDREPAEGRSDDASPTVGREKDRIRVGE